MATLEKLVYSKPKKKKKKYKPQKKATNLRLTREYLSDRAARSERWRWIEFSEKMLDNGFAVFLYEARQTVSKYITVTDGLKTFKVRFSNHKPIKEREANGDCDFFVGYTNFCVQTTEQAIEKTLAYFRRA